MRTITILAALYFFSSGLFCAVLQVPGQYASIQAAIDSAQEGDTVLVAPGLYLENVLFKGRSIAVQSSHGPEHTIIDGRQSGSAVRFVTGEGPSTLLEGFTITNGTGTSVGMQPLTGGGIYCKSSSPTLRNNIITGNSGALLGAGVALVYSESLLSGNQIVQNSGSEQLNGAGIYITFSTPILDHCTIRGNFLETAQSSTNCKGLGLYSNNSFVKLESCIVEENGCNEIAFCWGAGIYCLNSFLEATNSTIKNNRCLGRYASFGGGIYGIGSSITLRNNEICMNSADTWTDASSNLSAGGGGLCFESSYLTIMENSVHSNSCTSPSKNSSSLNFAKGGGLFLIACEGNIENNAIKENLALTPTGKALANGGGICIEGEGNLTVSLNTIRDNRADKNGGGIALESSAPTISKNTIFNNQAWQHGGGIASENALPAIRENSIASNLCMGKGAGLYCAGIADVLIEKNIVQSNGAVSLGGGLFGSGPRFTLLNNLFCSNQGRMGGGCCFWESESPGYNAAYLYNNTIYGNTAVEEGGGVYSFDYNCNLKNCILWNNTAETAHAQFKAIGPSKVMYCDVEGGHEGDGNIDDDPLFFDAAGLDFHLTTGSPCINRGLNYEAPAEDFEGQPRPFMGTADVGADEFTSIHRLEADAFTLSQSSGGVALFTLSGGVDHAGDHYLLLGSLSGTAPGFPLSGGEALFPLNWDGLTDRVLANLDIKWFFNFLGTLNIFGQNHAVLYVEGSLNPSLIGKRMAFAYCLEGDPDWDFVSNPIVLEVVP